MLAFRCYVLLAKAIVNQEHFWFLIFRGLDHQVLRFQIIVSPGGCMQDLEGVHNIMGHFEDEAHVDIWRTFAKELLHVQVKLLHDEVSSYLFIFWRVFGFG